MVFKLKYNFNGPPDSHVLINSAEIMQRCLA